MTALGVALVAAVAMAGAVVASRAVVAVPAGQSLRPVLPVGLSGPVMAAGALTLLGVVVAAVALPTMYWPAAWWLVFLAVTLSVIDLGHHRLPDALTLPGLPVLTVTLLVPATLTGDWGNLARALAGAAIFAVIFYAMWFAGMGYGDFKLSPTIGAALGWMGWGALAVGFIATIFIGLILALGAGAVRGARDGDGNRVPLLKSQFPFGPAMFLGVLVAALCGDAVIAWYLGTFVP